MILRITVPSSSG